MKNTLIEHTRAKKMRHCMVRKFVPLFKRVVVKETWLSGVLGEPLYECGNIAYWFNLTPTSIPKKMWAIVRAKKRKVGQLELIRV